MKKLVKDYKAVDDLVQQSLGGKLKGADLNSSTVDLDVSLINATMDMSLVNIGNSEPFNISDLTKLILLDDKSMD